MEKELFKLVSLSLYINENTRQSLLHYLTLDFVNYHQPVNGCATGPSPSVDVTVLYGCKGLCPQVGIYIFTYTFFFQCVHILDEI